MDAFTVFVTVVAGSLLILGWMLVEKVREIRSDIRELTETMKLIAASKRLSTYLAIERKSGLAISPEQFEANKPLLEARMLAELDEQIKRGRMENPGYASWNILGHSGFDAFVTTHVKLEVNTALTRLFTNNDLDGGKQLIHDIVAAL